MKAAWHAFLATDPQALHTARDELRVAYESGSRIDYPNEGEFTLQVAERCRTGE